MRSSNERKLGFIAKIAFLSGVSFHACVCFYISVESESCTLFGALLKDDHKETLQLIEKTVAYLGSAPNRAQIIPMLSSLCSVNCFYTQIQGIPVLMDLHIGKVIVTTKSLTPPRLDTISATVFKACYMLSQQRERHGTIFQHELPWKHCPQFLPLVMYNLTKMEDRRKKGKIIISVILFYKVFMSL